MLILAIEEPELYQHPIRQRHFKCTFELAGGDIVGVTQQTQVPIVHIRPCLLGLIALISFDFCEKFLLVMSIGQQAQK